MEITYCCTFWGCENDTPDLFIDKVLSAQYGGIEILLPPPNESFTKIFMEKLEEVINNHPGFIFIAQHLTAQNKDTVDEYISRMKKSLTELAAYQPNFINSHTGKDFFSFDDNCKAIEAALNISSKTGIRILHETHRGRFSFHAASLIPYLKKFPELELVGDFSHFCTVSESMLQDQEEILEQIIPHVSHIHARVGHEQSPQVNNPEAPEWQNHVSIFINWWKKIILHKQKNGWNKMTITPEFGPSPYMPSLPITLEPLSNQWQNNIFIMNKLKAIFKSNELYL